MNKQLYKVLTHDLKSPYQNFQYEVGEEYVCEDFDDDPSVDCSNGFYAVDIDGLIYPWQQNGATTVVPVEVSGRSVEIDQFKRRYEYLKIVGGPLTKREIKSKARDIEDELGYKLAEALYPVHPFEIEPPDEITDKHIQMIQQWGSVWDSVWHSVGDSVWHSVRGSVWDSVWHSVGDSVWDSVGGSVRDSVWAYIGSLFPGVNNWKYIDHEPGEYPFQPIVDLWYKGLVPSYDGDRWRLHGGPDGDILWEGGD